MSTDTCVIDTEDWQGSDICTVGDVGGGLFAEEIASEGDTGPGYAYSSLDLPADNGLEIIGRVTLIPAGLHIAAEEDTSGDAYADADGVYVAKWQLYVGLVPTGDEKDLEYIFGPVTADVGYTESSDTVSVVVQVGAASTVSLDIGYTEASDTVAVTLNVGRVDMAVGYTEASDTVAAVVDVGPSFVGVDVGYTEAGDTVAVTLAVEVPDPRYARPDSTVSAGAWLPSSGSSLEDMIDEPTADSADYIYTTEPGACEIALNPVVDPGTSSGQVVRYQAWSPDGNGLLVQLYQGATIIAAWNHASLPTTPTIYAQTLSPSECDSITNYADLRFKFTAA